MFVGIYAENHIRVEDKEESVTRYRNLTGEPYITKIKYQDIQIGSWKPTLENDLLFLKKHKATDYFRGSYFQEQTGLECPMAYLSVPWGLGVRVKEGADLAAITEAFLNVSERLKAIGITEEPLMYDVDSDYYD